ncbi:MAG: GDSL family lipase [Nitrospirae bacterium]|nr:GDSL family lipase [Nitrospirota bacterium]
MRLLFIGDSLIEYFDWQERFPSHQVYNLGIAGETVEGLLYRLSDILKNYPAADYVFVMTGINNVAMEDLDFFSTYEQLLKELKNAYPASRIYIHSLLPVDVDFIENSLIHTVNERLREMARRFDIGYIDIYRQFADERGAPKEGYLLDDGVHLSNKGYEVWSKEIEKVLKI